MNDILAIGRDAGKLVSLEQVLSDCIKGKVYLGVNENNLFRGLAHRSYDVLILDADDPVALTADTLRRIRLKWPRLRIVVMIDEARIDEGETLLLAGADRVVSRKVKRTAWRRILRALDRSAKVA